MAQKFGIFKAIGDQAHFGTIGGIGLVKLNAPLQDSEEEAKKYIDESPQIPAGASGFLIIPVTVYNKPVQN